MERLVGIMAIIVPGYCGILYFTNYSINIIYYNLISCDLWFLYFARFIFPISHVTLCSFRVLVLVLNGWMAGTEDRKPRLYLRADEKDMLVSLALSKKFVSHLVDGAGEGADFNSTKKIKLEELRVSVIAQYPRLAELTAKEFERRLRQVKDDAIKLKREDLNNQNTYNFTKICVNNATDASGSYSSFQQSMIQSSTAFGSLAASIPMTIALERYPKKFVLLGAGAVSTIATALIPLMESIGFGYFLTARVFQGVAFCVTFPMAGAVTAEWAALSEHGIFLAFLTGFSQLANIYLMPVAGALCASPLGWRAVYYVMAASGLVFFTLFALFFTDRPVEHRLISEEEKEWILKGRPEVTTVVDSKKNVHIDCFKSEFQMSEMSQVGKILMSTICKTDMNDELVQKPREREPVPYKAIFTSLTILGVWTSGFADILAIQFINMFNPQYLNDYLKYDVLNTGFLGAVPILVQWGFKIFAGISSDMIKSVSETLKLRIYNTIALALSAVFFIILSFMPQSQPTLCMIILVLTEGFIGFNTAGFNKCGTLHARQHAHFIMVMIVNIQSVCILIEPFIVNTILTDNTSQQWAIVFWVHAVLLIAASIMFLFVADSRPAIWTASLPQLQPEYTIEKADYGKDFSDRRPVMVDDVLTSIPEKM
ncbi:hypothetical protein PRIPAC_85822 [Pristionchus pacificus]|uniref:Membrane transporter n=1 Tax=Pristionchus pacificus TaxID=54126 RepID=A0A2A6BLF3_PRIPA|nr:hypothetical protein PRIPAC_85822 [Pristionchus pacificus]|eukprot:PDM66744.1 membrane transporter [Pristionchus pacificus]